MPDDIFDYFGGNSSRKVEPLDESELFDDLLPEKAEPESSAAAETKEETVPEIVDAELVEDTQSTGSEVNAETKTGSTAEQEKDPWSDLASTLGLEPTPAPPKSRTSVVLGEVGLVADLHNKNESKSEASKSEARPDEVVEEPVELVEQDDEDDEEILSDLFVAKKDSDADSQRESEEDFDDDPFAAFSGAASTADDDLDESDETEVMDIDEPSAEEQEESDPDFIEFEVTDLGGRVDKEREDRSERRPKRRRHGSSDAVVKKQDRDVSKSDDVRTGERSSRDEDRDSERKRRGGRGRSRPQDRDTIEQCEDDREQGPSPDLEAGDRSRDRDQIRGSDGNRDVDNEDQDKKKKPRIPTWQEAIGVVVDDNIKRHESKTNSGRGGKRRRRN